MSSVGTSGIGATDHVIRVPGRFATPCAAWRRAVALVADYEADADVDDDTMPAPIEVIGAFVVPPPDGPPSRDFQTLHVDFGLPLVPSAPADVARFTALHVPAAAPTASALTRFVPLRALVRNRSWPANDELVRRFAAYGDSHGTWQSGGGYLEGSLARIVEAALAEPPVLPSVSAEPGFLCGTEFATLDQETAFFAERGLPVDAVAIEIRLEPGELILFDNLAVAHGRRGRRAPGELHQRVFGHRGLGPREQAALRDRVLAAFAAG